MEVLMFKVGDILEDTNDGTRWVYLGETPNTVNPDISNIFNGYVELESICFGDPETRYKPADCFIGGYIKITDVTELRKEGVL
jgi:hypothetical protein